MKQMKGLIKFLIVLIILVTLLGAFVGTVLYLLTDNDINEPDYLKDSQYKEPNISEILSKGLEDTKNTKQIEFALDEKDLNILLKSTMLKLNEPLSSLNTSVITAYVDAENGQLKFASFFKVTNLTASLKGDFSYSLNNGSVTLSLKKINISKIEVTPSTVSNFISADEINSTVNEGLSDSGIKFNFSDEEISVSLEFAEVKKMLLEELGTTSDTSLYQTLLSLIFRLDNMISLTESADKLGLSINIDKLCFDENRDIAMPYKVDFDNISDKVEQLLNNNIITLEDVSAIGTYLVKGYEKLDGADRSKVDSIDFSTIGITNSSEYEGVLVYDNSTVEEIFTNQVPTDLVGLQNFSGFKLTEQNFNDILLQSKLVGGMYCFAREESDGYKLSYIAIESIYVDLIDDHFAIYLTMSLNGQSIVLNMEIDAKEAEGLKVDGEIKSLRIGSEMLNEDETKTLLSYLNNTVNEDWIKINPDNSSIAIDFTDMFSENTDLNNLLTQLAQLNINRTLKTKFNDGEILISY